MMSLTNLKDLSNLAKSAKERTAKEVLTVKTSEVTSKGQVRKRFRNIDELAQTLLSEGQQTPIIVYPKNDHGKYVIQKGERRWRACQFANIETIDIIINESNQTSVDEVAGELIENIQRDDLTPIEIAHALEVFIKKGWKQKQIAERIGKNKSYISSHLALLKLPNPVMELVEQDITADTETLNNLRILHETDEQQCIKVCEESLIHGISRSKSRSILDRAKETQEITTSKTSIKINRTNPENYIKANKSPRDIWIYVHVHIDSQRIKGRLILDKATGNPEIATVQLLEGDQELSFIKVHCSDIELTSIKEK